MISHRGQPVKFSPTTTFLGITLDRSLTFTGHVKTIKAKVLQRNNVLRAISGTTWGCSPSDLRSTYLAFSRACADYAAGAWMPGLSESGLRELETVQRQACRTITGCVRSTPVDALAREADLLHFSARRRQLAAVAMERHSRDLPGDPVQRILLPENRPRQRLRYDRGWARTGQEISKDAGLDDFPREPFLVVASTPPWESPPPPTVFFHTGLITLELQAMFRAAPTGAGRAPSTEQLPADRSHQATEQLPADRSHQATEQLPADRSHQATEQLPADRSHQATEQLPADRSHQATEQLPADRRHQAAEQLPADRSHQATEQPPFTT
ncbi:Sialidase [Amphibalanus amphitrite]|uniref:Sialidase n=1 Tax=Amphibalanus amphitrite TaxID=1232801 RepID=A0A6A4UZW5_AMPAM|nr:Sialidase [Amphibalanus amphitrite]